MNVSVRHCFIILEIRLCKYSIVTRKVDVFLAETRVYFVTESVEKE
jgi:hypothetical protein